MGTCPSVAAVDMSFRPRAEGPQGEISVIFINVMFEVIKLLPIFALLNLNIDNYANYFYCIRVSLCFLFQ